MKLPIYSPLKSRQGLLTRDGFMKNCYLEQSGENSFHNFRRPGLGAYGTFTGTGRGMAVLKDYLGQERLYAAFGSSLYAEGQVLAAATATYNVAATRPLDANSRMFNNPAMVFFGDLIFAIGPGGTSAGAGSHFLVSYSADHGVTWNNIVSVAEGTAGYPDPLVSGTPRQFHACVHNGAIYIAGFSESRVIWHTTDGVNWTQDSTDWSPSASGRTCQGLISHSDGKLYIAAADAASGNSVLEGGTDGVTWTVVAATPAWEASGTKSQYGFVSFGGNMYVIGGTNSVGAAESRKVYRSTNNGTTWAELGTDVLSSDFNALGSCMQAIMVGPVCYLQVFNLGATITWRLYYSLDFQTWTNLITDTTTVTVNVTINSTRFVFDGSYFVVEYSPAGVSPGNAESFLNLQVTAAGSQNISIGNVYGRFFDFAQNYARTKLAFKSEGAAYELDTRYGVVTRVTDADYPNITVRGLAYLDGVFYVMDTDGNIYNSGDEDFTSWSATEFIAAQFEPDGGVALIKHLNYIIAFGEYSIDMFYNAGNTTGSPLSPVQQGVIQVGCADGDTVGIMDSEIIFVGQSKSGGQSVAVGKFVAKLSGTNIQKISTPDIDRILELDDFAAADATTFKLGGHSWYHLRLGTTGISLVFDLSNQQWYVWRTRRTSFTHTATSVVTSAGTATATVTHSFADGDQMVVSAFSGTHTSLNGTFNVQVPSSTTLRWSLGGTSYSGTSTGTGTMTGYGESDFPVVCAASYGNLQLLQDKTNGLIYKLVGTTYTDNGVYMDWSVRLPKGDTGTNDNKFAAWADFVSDRVSGNVLLRFSDDDAQNWSKYRVRSMAGERTRWHRQGKFRRRFYEMRVTDAVAVKAEYLEVEVSGNQQQRAA